MPLLNHLHKAFYSTECQLNHTAASSNNSNNGHSIPRVKAIGTKMLPIILSNDIFRRFQDGIHGLNVFAELETDVLLASIKLLKATMTVTPLTNI